MKNDDYIVPGVNYCDGLNRSILYCILFVFMLVLYCFCVATEFSEKKDLYNMTRGSRKFWPDCKEVQHTCWLSYSRIVAGGTALLERAVGGRRRGEWGGNRCQQTVRPTTNDHCVHCAALIVPRHGCPARSIEHDASVNKGSPYSIIAKFHYTDTDTDTDPNGPAPTQRSFAAKKSVRVRVGSV